MSEDFRMTIDIEKKDLKIQALTEDKNNLNSLVTDLRVELTMAVREKEKAEAKARELEERLSSYESDEKEDPAAS